MFTKVCELLCGVGFCGGYCWFLLLGFPSGGYGCWIRVEVGWWLLCGGFGAVPGVGAYSVGLGWFVAEGCGCGRWDDCWGFLWVTVRGLLPPCLWRVCLCVTVGLGCGGSWQVKSTGLGACGGSFGVSCGVFLSECCYGVRGAVRVVFRGCVVMCGEWVCWGGRG